MNRALIEILRCPCCGRNLSLESEGLGTTVLEGRLLSDCGRAFSIADGLPDLVHPPGQSYLVEDAETYDRGIAFMASLLNFDQSAVRRSLATLLALSQGGRVLEIACGPGPNLSYLADAVGPNGQICALDISRDMLRAAHRRLNGNPSVTFILGNGCYLPFADASFDAVLHVGTLNRFDDIRRALAEMARVVKVGGRVAAADEGLAPWLEEAEYGRILSRFGTLFQGVPPLWAVPPTARNVALRWLDGQAFYVIDFLVDAEPPRPNLDAVLPGRTETVRDVLEATQRRNS
jgi:SAM-dependent methyltransferase